MLNPSVFKFSGLVAVVVRLKKWVKAVCKRKAFSTAFAHGSRSEFSSCPSTVKSEYHVLIRSKRIFAQKQATTRANTGFKQK